MTQCSKNNTTIYLVLFRDLYNAIPGPRPLSEKQYYGILYPYFPYLKKDVAYPNGKEAENLQNIYESMLVEHKMLFNEYFKNILLTQHYLKLLNKKFYFTSTFNYFSKYDIIRKKINSITNDTDIFYSKIDRDKFFLPENLGFPGWANKCGYQSFAQGHCGELAHIDFASLFMTWVNNNSDNLLE